MEYDISIIGRSALIIISLFVIMMITKIRLSKRSGNEFFVIMILFWSAILIIAIRPELIEPLLNDIGFVNRAQFLLALSMGIILYLLIYQMARNKETFTRYHQLVRSTTLSHFKNSIDSLSKENTDLVIVIVAKDEENTIGSVIDRINSLNLSLSYKILVIDDGSNDSTANIARNKNALVISHLFNLGIGGATKTGFLACKFLKPSFVVSIDSDNQHDPKYIPEMLALLKNNDTDLVYASRFHPDSNYSTTGVRLMGNKFYTSLVNKLGKISITDVTSGYRAIKFDKISSIFFLSETNFAIELALRAGRNNLKIAEIPTMASEREHGASQFHKIEKFLTYNTKALSQIFTACFRKVDFKTYVG